MFIRVLFALIFSLLPTTGYCARYLVLHGTVAQFDRSSQPIRVKYSQKYITIDSETGRIIDVDDKPISGLAEIKIEGVIYPGLIDLHNHLTWNMLPHWSAEQLFYNRYQWQVDQAYLIALDTPHKIADTQEGLCDSDHYAEIKAIIGGATSVVGSPSSKGLISNECIKGLARNLDAYPDFEKNNDKRVVSYKVRPLDMTIDEMNNARRSLQNEALVVHLAEGTPQDQASALEFREFIETKGFLQTGVAVIHGTALQEASFNKMAENHVGLIWSPRSNIELYGVTTDVKTAKARGVTIAIGPDWSPTGSSGMLDELKYAATWNQSNPTFSNDDLVQMVTTKPAELASVSAKIGEIKPGMFADFLVLSPKVSEVGNDALLLHSSPEQVSLVMIGAKFIYGNQSLMDKFPKEFRPLAVEEISVCGAQKMIDIDTLGGVSFRALQLRLREKLKAEGSTLAPYATCEDSNQK